VTLRARLRSIARDPRIVIAAILVTIAVIPSFTASPGLIPADSKLGLYLNPGRLISDAWWSYDARLFAGWVPHQQIGFIWPSGPWFWLGEWIGLSTWVTHRLWISVLLIAAGAGVVWCGRRLGLSWTAAAFAGIVYELSPYLLAYVSRTSVMLLPWAGLGWIVGLTVVATAARRWREPALLALVILTVGGVNATALAMIAPAPALWLVHARWSGLISTANAVVTAGRIALLSAAVSLWWMVMLIIQRNSGAPVLNFSENLSDVSATSTAPEVLRGLGYWLFYVRDRFSATTAASIDHLGRTSTLTLNFAVVVAGFAAVATTSWIHRRFVALLIATGVVLAVGVYPLADPAPVMSMLTGGDPEAGIALALRSSTRAVPMIVLGLALAIGARASLWIDWRGRARRSGVISAAVVGLVIVNIPAWWTGGFVDRNLERRDPPEAWLQAADELNSMPTDRRLLQIPGAEFGVFRWGQTNDQPLISLIDRPLVTRDLLPLGSPQVMDLTFALDDRVHDHTLEPNSVAAIARFLGVDAIWITNDLAHERYLSARPEPLRMLLGSADGLAPLWDSPQTIVNASDPPRIDERSIVDVRIGAEVPTVVLLGVGDPLAITRIGGELVALVGSGDGLIDAAAAGLLDGSEVVVTDPSAQRRDAIPQRLIITDSNRSRPHHWRTSQEVVGATESSDDQLGIGRRRVGDQRLDVGANPLVTAEQSGPVRATASDYGTPFSYQPEYRPVMAIDGDPETAWLIIGDATSQTLRLIRDEPGHDLSGGAIDHLVVLQAQHTSQMITEIAIKAETGSTSTVALDSESLTAPGQRVELPDDIALQPVIDIEILRTGARPDETSSSSPRTDGVGFAEISLGHVPTLEVVTIAQSPWSERLDPTIVLTRHRTDPMRRGRSDPEPRLVREFSLQRPTTLQAHVEIGIDARASDSDLVRLIGGLGVASQRLHGAVAATASGALDGDAHTAWISPFSPSGPLWIDFEIDSPTQTLSITQPSGDHSRITAISIDDGPTRSPIVMELDTIDDGASRLALPRSIGPGRVRVEVTGFEGRETIDRHTQREVVLPVAISEIDPAVPIVAIPAEFQPECRDDLLSINSTPLAVTIGEIEYDPLSGSFVTSAQVCDDTVEVISGPNRVIGERVGAMSVDRVVLSPISAPRETSHSAVISNVESSRLEHRVTIGGCAAGCWVIHGDGHNDAWRATIADTDLGPPIAVSGGVNGWYLTPGLLADGSGVVTIHWTAQRPLTVAWIVSALSAAACLVLIVTARRTRFTAPSSWRPRRPSPPRAPSRQRLVAVGFMALASGLVIGPIWAVIGAIVGTLALLRHRALDWFAVFSMTAVAAGIVITNRFQRPAPNLAWPSTFAAFHDLTMFAVVALLAATLVADDAVSNKRTSGRTPQ